VDYNAWFRLQYQYRSKLFKNIIPCGIDDKDVTSMERELGHKVNFDEVSAKLKANIAKQFSYIYS
jgi:lipoyl(octanoyl) transferase